MKFDATAIRGLIPSEKSEPPACRWPLILEDEEKAMTNKQLDREIAQLWNDMRDGDDMVVDAPSNKVGMPYPMPYEGVCFPVEVDGVFSLVSIPVHRVAEFAAALLLMIPESIAMDAEIDAEIGANDAIEKAKGR